MNKCREKDAARAATTTTSEERYVVPTNTNSVYTEAGVLSNIITFDNQKHADSLLDADGLLADALMLAEGMSYENTNIDDQQNAATLRAAMRLIAHSLEEAFTLVSEAESNFRLSHGLHYGDKPICYHKKVTDLWLDYYHKLTGNEGAPHYDDRGNLFWWIAEYAPKYQTEILHICYEAGYKTGLAAVARIPKAPGMRTDIEPHDSGVGRFDKPKYESVNFTPKSERDCPL